MGNPTKDIKDDILNRIQGSMIGMALGDALGAHVEFRPREFLLQNPVTDLEGGGTWGLKKGQFTDDTSMALCLAASLVCRRDFVPYDQLVRYKWWFQHGYMSSTGRCFDIGAATSDSLHEFEHRQQKFAAKHKIPIDQLDFLSDAGLLTKFNVECSSSGVAGNGALMRLAPVPLFFYRYPAHAVEYSGFSGMITHGDKKAYDACRYYGALIVATLQGAEKEELLDNKFYEKHSSWFNSAPLVSEIMKIAHGSYKQNGGYDAGIRGKGYIVNALEAALWAFWSEETFEEGALAAVNLGDDTDTTAAIYGQLAGAYYGYRELPEKWLKYVYAKNFLLGLSRWIAYEGEMWQPNKPPPSTISLLSMSSQQNTVVIPSDHQELDAKKRPLTPKISNFSSQQTFPGETRLARPSDGTEQHTVTPFIATSRRAPMSQVTEKNKQYEIVKSDSQPPFRKVISTTANSTFGSNSLFTRPYVAKNDNQGSNTKPSSKNTIKKNTGSQKKT
ncbi:unnamed protein product [Rotaria sp. Silwood2]|nr:unnamed protein product [Rotaria sp. Silwood2]CAF4065628.1 unnamed protein product [Rotaria sp. Silwood2]